MQKEIRSEKACTVIVYKLWGRLSRLPSAIGQSTLMISARECVWCETMQKARGVINTTTGKTREQLQKQRRKKEERRIRDKRR